jgi:hypothetical protein
MGLGASLRELRPGPWPFPAVVALAVESVPMRHKDRELDERTRQLA